MTCKEVEISDGIYLAVDRQYLQTALCRIVNHRASLNLGNTLTSRGTASFSTSTPLLVVGRLILYIDIIVCHNCLWSHHVGSLH
jgi:uncharacterized protein with PIN domain